jgi:UDP-GlcNAc:undecaprenyl-phosphate GlcNAc-1-phosphate transferase
LTESPSLYTLLLGAAAAFALALLVSHLLTPVMRRLAELLEALDHPDERKHQEVAVPRLGGVAIFAGVVLGTTAALTVWWETWQSESEQANWIVTSPHLATVAIAVLMIFLVGLADDLRRKGISASKKFLVQVAAASLLVSIGWWFKSLTIPIPFLDDKLVLGWLGPLVTVLWIVGVTNAINLIDGLDQLAGGVVTIISFGLLISSLVGSATLLGTVLLAAMMGACVGFLPYNRPDGENGRKRRIFMGDSGSLTLGFLLAVVSIHPLPSTTSKATTAVAILVPVLALGLPVMDTLAVMAVRFLDRPHGPLGERFLRMFSADRNHLHHVLESFVANRRRIVGLIYGAVFSFCMLALLVAWVQNTALGLVLVAVEIVAVLVLRNMDKLPRRHRKAEEAGEADEATVQVPPTPLRRRRARG